MTISTATLNVGFGGLAKHACAALADNRSVLGVCEQERITRVQGAGGSVTGIPDEALDALLAQTRRGRAEIESCAIAEVALSPTIGERSGSVTTKRTPARPTSPHHSTRRSF